MLDKIKTYFKNKSIKRICAHHKSVKRYRSDSEISRILLLFDGTEVSKYGRINNVVKQFKKEGKTVTCLAYFDKKELDDICLTQNNIQFISKSDFDWKGIPGEEFIDEFLKYRYHLCLNLDLSQSDNVTTLFNLSDAELKAGKNFNGDSVADMVINVTDDKDETFLAEQIKYYLRSINSVEH